MCKEHKLDKLDCYHDLCMKKKGDFLYQFEIIFCLYEKKKELLNYTCFTWGCANQSMSLICIHDIVFISNFLLFKLSITFTTFDYKQWIVPDNGSNAYPSNDLAELANCSSLTIYRNGTQSLAWVKCEQRLPYICIRGKNMHEIWRWESQYRIKSGFPFFFFFLANTVYNRYRALIRDVVIIV